VIPTTRGKWSVREGETGKKAKVTPDAGGKSRRRETMCVSPEGDGVCYTYSKLQP
jgi:hypothetical protein